MKNRTKNKVPVSERALILRINRKLKRDGKVMKIARSDSRAEQAYGRYFIVDVDRNQATDADCDLAALGRDLGVLHDYESVTVK
jgi:hypothetical protein